MNMQKKVLTSLNSKIILILFLLTPVVVSAHLTRLKVPFLGYRIVEVPKLPEFILHNIKILSILIVSLMFVGIILFIYGLMKYIIDVRKKQKITLAKLLLFSGMILSIIMMGLWWFVDFAQTPIGLQSASGPGGIILMADITQDPILLGASHNIFIGKILAQTGTTESPAGIRTQYSVEVISNIKGNLDGVITVEQEGGFKDGILQTIEDAFPLLEQGSDYVLATRYNAPADAYTVLANEHAGKLLTKDSSLDNAQLKILAGKDAKVKSLEAAYPDEKLLDADIAHANTRNSFQSLSSEAKAAAVARADVARTWLETNKAAL